MSNISEIDSNSRLKKYIDEFTADTTVTIQNIKDKSMLVSSIRAKWIRYYFIEKELNDKLKNTLVIYSKQLKANRLSSANTQSAFFPTINTAEQDEDLQKIKSEIRKSDNCIEYINKAFNVLENFNFQIKNVIDIIKLENL